MTARKPYAPPELGSLEFVPLMFRALDLQVGERFLRALHDCYLELLERRT